MERFVIDAAAPTADPTRAAIDWLLSEAVGALEEGAMIVPSVPAISNLGEILVPGDLAAAERHRLVTIGITRIRVLSLRRLPFAFAGPIFVPWADRETVEKAEALRPRAVCTTGWLPEDFEAWRQTWGPTDLKTREAVTAGTASDSKSSPDFEAAIVKSVSHPSGGNSIGNVSDKRRAVNAFKALRKLGLSFDPEKVRVMARRRGWTSDAADRIAETARKIDEGRRVNGGDTLTKSDAKKIVEGLEAWGAEPSTAD